MNLTICALMGGERELEPVGYLPSPGECEPEDIIEDMREVTTDED